MGSLLDKPETEKYNESNSCSKLRYGLSAMQGWRLAMEDAHTALLGLPQGQDTVSWFAVFDGHGGGRISSYASTQLLDCIQDTDKLSNIIGQEHNVAPDQFIRQITAAIRHGFLALDEKMRTIPEVASGEDKSGSTAVGALVTERYIVMANCGDSRGVCCVDGNPALVTLDHKPTRADELERIRAAGGTVEVQRVDGSLGVSRCLGDFEYKKCEGRSAVEQKVSPEPEFFVKPILPDRDEFLILACDGIWDKMSNRDICNFVASRMRITEDLETIANEVVDTCLYKGSKDNMSIIIVAFPNAPKPDPEAIILEDGLNQLLETKVKEMIDRYDGNVDLSKVFQVLEDELTVEVEKNVITFPPGGGFSSKKGLIAGLYEKLLPEKYASGGAVHIRADARQAVGLERSREAHRATTGLMGDFDQIQTRILSSRKRKPVKIITDMDE